jgi:hypothetical protein
MKIASKDIFKNKNYAKYIATHPIFDKIEKVNKVFPGIGLPNCEDDKIVNNAEIAAKSAKTLIGSITASLDKREKGLNAFVDTHPKMGEKRKEKAENLIKIINATKSLIADNVDKCVLVDKKCVKIMLPGDLTIDGGKKPIFKANKTIISVYGKINELLQDGKFARMKNIDNDPAFKEFSKDNIPNAGLKVVFSSEGSDGIWDIATMSMRGVSSCQSWQNGAYKHGVIGSMIDPFVGIIYLTTGGNFNEYGSKMIKRCIVRYVVDGKTKKPYLALDNMYPSFDANVLTQFIEFLKARVSNKLEVYFASHLYGRPIYNTSYVPLTKVRESLENYGARDPYSVGAIVAYQDVKFPSKKSTNDPKEALYAKNIVSKGQKFTQNFIAAATEAFKNIDIKLFPEAIHPTIQSLTGVAIGKGLYNNSYLIPELMRVIAKGFIESVNSADFANSDTYIRRVYYNYFNRKELVFSSIKNNLVKQMNGGMGLKKKNRINADHLTVMMQVILSKTDDIMRDKLRKLVSRRKFSGASPIPDGASTS